PHHPVQWLTAAPLWDLVLADKSSDRRFRQPALLRFASDSFMADLIALLGANPAGLKDLVARYETWESETAGWTTLEAENSEKAPKLYQPAHARFYMVAASLVCRIPGMPDRLVDTGAQEKVSFVLRRLRPVTKGGTVDPKSPGTYREHAWVPGGTRTGWFPLADPLALPDDEERLPMFSLGFADGDLKRRLHAGFIPVASRETYQAAGALSPFPTIAELKAPPSPGAEAEPDPRMSAWDPRVEGALANLNAAPTTDITAATAREVSSFILYDLAEFLSEQLPTVFGWVMSPPATVPAGNDKAVYDKLNEPMGATTWSAALRDTWNRKAAILRGEASAYIYNLRGLSLPAGLKESVVAALGPIPNDLPQEQPTVPKVDPGAGDYYLLRCVYERPQCKGIHPPAVSEATRPFQLAGFFDPDAPVRPVRVVLPADTSIAGLKRFKKGVSFLVSDKLRSQVQRFQKLKLEDLDKGDVGDEKAFDFGMICTLSIPIITICALILLFIIVQLLNIVFWWLPLLKICFPMLKRR
ncbi:MAG TPA: hypothetical protein VD902_11380, partial [Symbiobacteriaceae bacterium]|nr:hypothetical protein [Symbiobacteriaceae bacterium]